jgi:hypothetical protein
VAASSNAPVVPLAVIALGDSWTLGNEQQISRASPTITPTDRWTNQLATAQGVTENTTASSDGGTSDIVVSGYGGQITSQINTNDAAAVAGAPNRATKNLIAGPGRNDTPNSTGVTDYFTGLDAILARYPHERKLVWPPYSAITSKSDGSWPRSQRILWTLRSNTYRKYLFELPHFFQGLAPNGSSGTAADDISAAVGSLIPTLCASAGADQQHPNYLAAPLWSAAMSSVVTAMKNGSVYTRNQTVKVAYNIAAGTKIEVYCLGYATSCSIAVDDPVTAGLFTIAMKAGSNDTAELTRTSVSAANLTNVVNLQVNFAGLTTLGASVNHTGFVRIVPCQEGSGVSLPAGVRFLRDDAGSGGPAADHRGGTTTSRRWPSIFFEAGIMPNGTQLSVFIGQLKFTVDSDAETFIGAGTSGLRMNFQRNSTNHLIVTIKDTAGTSCLAWTVAAAPNLTIANGPFNIYFSLDLNGGGAGIPAAHLWAWSAATGDVNISPGTALNFGNGSLETAAVIALFSNSNSQSSFAGGFKNLWIDNRFFDFSVLANRQKFASGATLVDLGFTGTVDAVQPKGYLIGSIGDIMSGKNYGSSFGFAYNDNWRLGFGITSDPQSY